MTADSGESAVVAVTAPVATTTSTAPAVAPIDGRRDAEQGEAESPPPSRWGEIEVRPRNIASSNPVSLVLKLGLIAKTRWV